MVTLHEVITFLVSMQISISSLQTHNVNRCGRSRHLARKLSLRRKRSSPNVFEMAATETITIQRINIIGSREGSRNRRRLKANQTGKKFRVGIKSNISTNRNNLISGVDRCIHLNAMKKTTI